MDNQLQAEFSLIGQLLDAFGGLLLAYDLLGGERGPLRFLLRVVFYSILSGAILAITLGLKFAIVAGLSFGLSLSFELARKAAGMLDHNFKHEMFLAAIRSIGVAAALAYSSSVKLGIVFGALSFVLVAVLQWFKLLPSFDYETEKKPVLKMKHFVFATMRSVLIALIGWISAMLCGEPDINLFGLKFGLAFGATMAFVSIFVPMIEWWVDRVPDRMLGTWGVFIFVIGFIFQAVPSLVVVLKSGAVP